MSCNELQWTAMDGQSVAGEEEPEGLINVALLVGTKLPSSSQEIIAFHSRAPLLDASCSPAFLAKTLQNVGNCWKMFAKNPKTFCSLSRAATDNIECLETADFQAGRAGLRVSLNTMLESIIVGSVYFLVHYEQAL